MTAAIERAAAYQVASVRRVDALVSQGRPLSDALWIVGLAQTTYERWRSEMGVNGRAAASAYSGEPSPDSEELVAKSIIGDAPADRDALTISEQAGPQLAVDPPVPEGQHDGADAVAPVSVAPREARAPDPGGEPMPASIAHRARIGEDMPAPFAHPQRRLRRFTRTVFLGVLLAGAPAVAVAALVIWVQRGQVETNEALQRHGAEIAELRQRGKAAETSLGQPDQRAKTTETRFGELDERAKAADTAIARVEALARQARPQLDVLRGEAASDRAELARVRGQVAGMAAAQPTLLAKLEAQQREFLSWIETVRERATADRSEIAALRTGLSSSSDEQVARAAELQGRQKDLSAQVDSLRQQASADRSALTQLAGKALDLPRVVSAFERRQADLADQLSKVREEISTYRSALGQLEGRVDAIRRVSAQRGPQSEETASIAPGGAANGPSEADPPAQAGAGAQAALVNGAPPRVVLRIARNDSARSAAAKLQARLQARGANIVIASNAPSGVRTNRVIYYYDEDRTSAESIASGLSISRPVQKLFSEDESLPRPGTIDVAIVQDEGRGASVEMPFPSPPVGSPPAKRTAVEATPIEQVVVTPHPLVNKVAGSPAAKKPSKPRVDRRFASRKQLPIRLDQRDGIFLIDQADEMSREYQPVSSLLPAAAGVVTATIDPAADDGRPETAEGRYPKGSRGCTRYKTYDAQTLTYRGFDGVVRPCRPL